MALIEAIQWQTMPIAVVISRITSAFPETSPPDEQNLVPAEPDHLRKCEECRDAKQFITGKTREEILGDERNFAPFVNAFGFLTPQAWHYFLPAFLIQDLLRQRQSFEWFWHWNEPVLLEKSWPPRIERLNGLQCEALLDYLESCRPHAIVLGRTDRLGKVIE